MEIGLRERVIQVLEELQSDWAPEFVHSEEVRACQPFGAGLQTQYADWLLEADRDDTSWLRTSSVKTQLRAKQKRKLEMEAPSMLCPYRMISAAGVGTFCYGEKDGERIIVTSTSIVNQILAPQSQSHPHRQPGSSLQFGKGEVIGFWFEQDLPASVCIPTCLRPEVAPETY